MVGVKAGVDDLSRIAIEPRWNINGDPQGLGTIGRHNQIQHWRNQARSGSGSKYGIDDRFRVSDFVDDRRIDLLNRSN